MKKLIAGLSIYFLFLSSAFAANLYVRSDGNDTNCNGTVDVADSAGVRPNCAEQTWQAAINETSGTDTITVHADTGNLGASYLIFDNSESGDNITIQAAAGETVNFTNTHATYGVLISSLMTSGSVTFSGINFSTAGTFTIQNPTYTVSTHFINCNVTNTGSGRAIYYEEGTAHRISLTTGDDGWIPLRYGTDDNIELAQKFTVGGTTITPNIMSIKLKKTGNFLYEDGKILTLRIETDNEGSPSGTVVTNGTSASVPVYNITTNGEYIYGFTFATAPSLTNGTAYHLILSGDYDVSSTNYISWAIDTTSGGYAGGDAEVFDSSWGAIGADQDFMFQMNKRFDKNLTLTNTAVSGTMTPVTSIAGDTFTMNGGSITYTDTTSSSAVSLAGGTRIQPGFRVVKMDGITVNGNGLTITAPNNTWNELISVTNSTISDSKFLTTFNGFSRRLYIYNNSMTLSYQGTLPINFGTEPSTDGKQTAFYPAESIIVEKNSIRYTGTNITHIVGMFLGADNGVFRNNTLWTTAASSAQPYGIVLKANNWKIEGNIIHYPFMYPLYVSGGSNNYIVHNTFVTNNSTACVVFNKHQDYLYNGGKYGLPMDNYFADNVCVNFGTGVNLVVGDTNAVPSVIGTGRSVETWSNYLNNNISYTASGTGRMQLYGNNGGSTANTTVTQANGVSVAKALWKNSIYTSDQSLSYWNDTTTTDLMWTDPKLKNPSAYDFGINFDSVARGTATDGLSDIGGKQRREMSPNREQFRR